MADFGRGSGDYIRPYRNVEVRHYPEDASQSFKRGEPLILGGAGLENKVKIASDNPTAAVVGIAAEDASGTTGNKVAVWLAKPNAEFRGKAIASDAADYTDINKAKAVQKDGTNVIWEVDTTDDGNDSVVPLALLNNNLEPVVEADADLNYWVVFRFADAATIWGSTL